VTRSLISVVRMEIQMREVTWIERREETNQTLARMDPVVAADPPIDVIVIPVVVILMVIIMIMVVVVVVTVMAAEINTVLLAQAEAMRTKAMRIRSYSMFFSHL